MSIAEAEIDQDQHAVVSIDLEVVAGYLRETTTANLTEWIRLAAEELQRRLSE